MIKKIVLSLILGSILFGGVSKPLIANEEFLSGEEGVLKLLRIRLKADQGNVKAQHALGLIHYNGLVGPEDRQEAEFWFLKAAENGYAESQYLLGIMYTGRYEPSGFDSDYKKAFYWFEKAAEQNHAEAQMELGSAYERGVGVPQNYTLAIKWFLKSAEQGNDRAQGSMGYMYSKGLGVPKDYKLAGEWYHKSAEQGNGQAQHMLGLIYSLGKGVPQSFLWSYVWSSVAAANGIDGASDTRDIAEKILSGKDLIDGQKLAVEYFSKYRK